MLLMGGDVWKKGSPQTFVELPSLSSLPDKTAVNTYKKQVEGLRSFTSQTFPHRKLELMRQCKRPGRESERVCEGICLSVYSLRLHLLLLLFTFLSEIILRWLSKHKPKGDLWLKVAVSAQELLGQPPLRFLTGTGKPELLLVPV